jgi:hypothetical protein
MKKKTTKTKTKKAAAAPLGRLAYAYVPTARFADAWTFLTEIAGGKAKGTWGNDQDKSGSVELAGTEIILGSEPATEENQELGYPVRHGSATLFFATPDLDKTYHALANRGAKVLRGPLKTHWGQKVMTVKAGDLVVAFVETKRGKKR